MSRQDRLLAAGRLLRRVSLCWLVVLALHLTLPHMQAQADDQYRTYVPVVGASLGIGEHAAQWRRHAITRYQFSFARMCFCFPAVAGTVVVTDGQIVAVTDQKTGQPVAPAQWPAYRTIDDLFAILADAEASGAAYIRVAYDATYGYPTDMYIDYDRHIIDEEIGYSVRSLVPVAGR